MILHEWHKLGLGTTQHNYSISQLWWRCLANHTVAQLFIQDRQYLGHSDVQQADIHKSISDIPNPWNVDSSDGFPNLTDVQKPRLIYDF